MVQSWCDHGAIMLTEGLMGRRHLLLEPSARDRLLDALGAPAVAVVLVQPREGARVLHLCKRGRGGGDGVLH
eukprot:1914394-Prymnesium_polylepis.1